MDLEGLLDFARRRRDPLLALGLVLLAGLALTQLLAVLSPFLIALVAAYVLAPVVELMRKFGTRKRRPSRMFCVVGLFVMLGGAIAVFGLPVLVNIASGLVKIAQGLEGADLQAEALTLVQRYRSTVEELPLPEDAKVRVQQFFSQPEEIARLLGGGFEKARVLLSAVLRGGAKLVGAFLSAGVQFVLVPVLLFYFLLEYDELRPTLMNAIPIPYRPWVDGFLDKVDVKLGGFIRGQLLIAFLFGVIMTVGLWMIGIRWAIVIGPASGLANLVPYLGIFVGLIPAFFIAIWQGGLSLSTVWMCFAILLLFAFLQAVDGYVFQPRILGPSVDLHPLTIMLALALGEHWMGLAGMMLAVPVTAILRVIMEEVYPMLYEHEYQPSGQDGDEEE